MICTSKIWISILIVLATFSLSAQEERKPVHEMPRFPGCEERDQAERESCAKSKLLMYVYRNLKYPRQARREGVEGMPVIKFKVGIDGYITDIEVMKDPGLGLAEAAVEVIESMNYMTDRWIPGKSDDEAISVEYILPIKFKLPE